MPQATSPPQNSSPRRYHPASQSSRPRRPYHPPNPPLRSEPNEPTDMTTVSSSIRPPTYWTNPGPYVQPGRSNSASILQAPPPHVLPTPIHRQVDPSLLPKGPLPQRPTPDPNRNNMDSLADAAMARRRSSELARLPPVVTRIQFSNPPPSPAGYPQHPPGYVPESVTMSFTAPYQLQRIALPLPVSPDPAATNKPLPPARIRPADETPFDPHPPPAPSVVTKLKKKKKLFGEVSYFVQMHPRY